MQIGFIDYSREERNRILATLQMLGRKEALDELGIGVVRDAYADILFPGISTLQTRAKYFVLLPYLFQRAYERSMKGELHNGRELLQWINESEDRLAATLANNCPSGESGIIGSSAYREKRSVKVKPSAIYWNGLRVFGIFTGNNMSISNACKFIYAKAKQRAEAENNVGTESFDDPTAVNQGSVLFLPINPEPDFEKNATIDLTTKEAEFLSGCIQRSPLSSRSLLSFFVKNRLVSNDFLSVPVNLLPEVLRRDYMLARDFSRFIYGAHIRYNVIYSEYSDHKMDDKYKGWRDTFLADPIELEPVLERVSCPPALAAFSRSFLEAVKHNDNNKLDDLIVRREFQVKGDRSKLRKPAEYRYSPVHDYELNFRFDRARVIIQDILKGLGGNNSV